MDLPPKEPLQMGKVAFAKAFCSDWFASQNKILFATLATFATLVCCLFLLQNPTHEVPSLNSTYYTRFSNNTKQITSGQYAHALQEAHQLKKDLQQDILFWNKQDKWVKSGTLLYAYNLLRIASLERQLGSIEGELAAWEEFLSNSGWETQPQNPLTYDPEAYALVASNFQEGKVSLLDFIRERKALLLQTKD